MTEKIADLTYTILDQVQKFLRENLFFPLFTGPVFFSEKKDWLLWTISPINNNNNQFINLGQKLSWKSTYILHTTE